jgi:aminoglycoside phosphotransferase (APT) family kinase protein
LIRDYRIGYYRDYPLVSFFIDTFNQNKTNHIEDSVILHGDFSLNNIIIDTNNQLSVIDWVYGTSSEPAKDFVRNLVNAEKSQDFACGLIDGYFIDSTPPMSFWRSLKMYTAVHQLELIELHLKYGFQSEEFILNNHKLAYQQYKSTDQLVPDYYLSGRNKNECG